jgi:hypothetical protein
LNYETGKAICCGLNVSASPKFTLKPNSQCNRIGKCDLWEGIESQGLPPQQIILSSFTKGLDGGSFCLSVFCHVMTQCSFSPKDAVFRHYLSWKHLRALDRKSNLPAALSWTVQCPKL